MTERLDEVRLARALHEDHRGHVATVTLHETRHGRELASFESVWQGHTTSPVMDGPLLAIVHWAMERTRRLCVDGELSPVFLEHLYQLQEYWANYYPGQFIPFALNAEVQRRATPADADWASLRPMMAAFSGGVDATTTALRHCRAALGTAAGTAPDSPKGYRLNTLIMMHGADIAADKHEQFAGALQRGQKIAEYLGCTIQPVWTNIRQRLPGDWEITHGAQLASELHLFSGLSDLALVASSASYVNEKRPWGSAPAVDHLHGGNALRIVHDGAGINRFQKVCLLAKHPDLIPLIRVCWAGPDLAGNCGVCRKCVTTRVLILAAGASDAAFPGTLSATQIDGLQTLTLESVNSQDAALQASRAGGSRLTAGQIDALARLVRRQRTRQSLRDAKAAVQTLVRRQ